VINNRLEKVTIDEIKSLVENSVCENKCLEYKQELHIDSDSDKKEFLADISSFANSNGGDMIFGIVEDEKEKIPTNIIGIEYENEDTLIRKLEDFIRQSIQPIILNIEYKVIDLEKNKCILIIRIPQSIIAPHRVEYKGHCKFYTRNNKGKYQMDVSELRMAFNSSIDLEKRIEEYKLSRCYELIANRYGNLISDSPIFVIHYIPLSALNYSNNLSIIDMERELTKLQSKALGYGYNKNIIVDGITIHEKTDKRSAIASYKINGIIEKATTSFFKKDYVNESISPSKTVDLMNGYLILEKVIEDFAEIKNYYNDMGISTPIIISCSIINAVNFTIPTRDWYDILGKIDREILFIKNLYIEDFNEKPEIILKPIFDSIWNACGYKNCIAYDKSGNYIGLK